MKRFTLTDLAEQTIDDVTRKGGIVTPQDVLWIQKLSLDIAEERRLDSLISRGKPVQLDAENWLYPLTIAGTAFFDELGVKDEALSLVVLAYACRFGNDPERMYKRGSEALRDVKRWRRTLHTTYDHLTEVLESLVSDTVPSEDLDEIEREERSVCLSLTASALAGGSPQMWETLCCVDAVCDIIETVVRQKLAELESAKDAPMLEKLRTLGEYEMTILKRQEKNGK